MKRGQWGLLILACVFTFVLVYLPHFNYKYPLHVDEWYHISETIKLKTGDYVVNGGAFRIGFDIFLLPLSYSFDLVKIYQYLPALWAVLTALVLFWIVNKKSGKFFIALLSVIFFASLKSNVNLQGLWFFIPSVFAIPFIYLFIYLYTEGIEKQNKKYILWSLGLMLIVLLVHSVSLFFAVPFLFIYSLLNYKYILKEWKFFSLFLIIPILGVIFYSLVREVNFASSIVKGIYELQFPYGRMPLELNNSFFELYSPIGYILALLGAYYLVYNYGFKTNKYLAYLLWSIFTFISILIFKTFDVSFFAPYQRTMYYFAISLPFLSAFGVYYLFKIKNDYIERNNRIKDKERKKIFSGVIIMALILLMTFYSYNSISPVVKVYHMIEEKDYEALTFLNNYSYGRLMAPADISMASYAVSGKPPVGAVFFYGNKTKVEKFLSSNNCSEQQNILKQQSASYVLLKNPSSCNWTLIYNKTDVIYDFRQYRKSL
jgi:hypothetical protein